MGSHVFSNKDLHQAVKSKKTGENKKAKVLWTMKETQDKVVNFSDAGHEKEIKTRAQFRLDLWVCHFFKKKNPTAASAKASEGLEQGESVPSVTSEW